MQTIFGDLFLVIFKGEDEYDPKLALSGFRLIQVFAFNEHLRLLQ